MKKYKNKTVYIREEKDTEHPFDRISVSITKNTDLDYCEKAIMIELLSHSDEYVINKAHVRKVLNMPHGKFHEAWTKLEEKHFIIKETFFGGTKWIINEKGNFDYSKYLKSSTVNAGMNHAGMNRANKDDTSNELEINTVNAGMNHAGINHADVNLITTEEITTDRPNLSTQDLRALGARDEKVKSEEKSKDQIQSDSEGDLSLNWSSGFDFYLKKDIDGKINDKKNRH